MATELLTTTQRNKIHYILMDYTFARDYADVAVNELISTIKNYLNDEGIEYLEMSHEADEKEVNIKVKYIKDSGETSDYTMLIINTKK